MFVLILKVLKGNIWKSAYGSNVFFKNNRFSLATKMDIHWDGQNITTFHRGLTNRFQTERVNSLTKVWPDNDIQGLWLTDL